MMGDYVVRYLLITKKALLHIKFIIVFHRPILCLLSYELFNDEICLQTVATAIMIVCTCYKGYIPPRPLVTQRIILTSIAVVAQLTKDERAPHQANPKMCLSPPFTKDLSCPTDDLESGILFPALSLNHTFEQGRSAIKCG